MCTRCFCTAPRTACGGAGVIDLDHQRMPDPVGKALACVLERIAELEQRVARNGAPGAEACRTCDPDDCVEPTFVKPFMHGPTNGGKSE